MAPRRKANEVTPGDVPVGIDVKLYLSRDDIKKLNASPPDRNLVKAVIRLVTAAANPALERNLK